MKDEKKAYENAEIEVVPVSEDDAIRTSITIELPWLPLMDDEKEI